MDPRATTIQALAALIATGIADLGHPARIAVDGVTGSGKTTLADELATAFAPTGRAVHRLTMDGYHHPRAHRHRQGRGSADGYYEDAYDLDAFRREVLEPLGTGAGTYRPAILDLATDAVVEPRSDSLPRDGLLIVDGSFLQRAEVHGRWDLVIWVNTSFEVAEERGSTRDAQALGGIDQARALFRTRYHAAGRRYVAEVDPAQQADVVLDNDDLRRPTLHVRHRPSPDRGDDVGHDPPMPGTTEGPR